MVSPNLPPEHTDPRTHIFYRAGYKYQLAREYRCLTGILPERAIRTQFLTLDLVGELTIRRGYAWNGADVIPDDKEVMRASLVHDALYQLLRDGHLEQKWRLDADQILMAICIEDDLSPTYAQAIFAAVRMGGGPAADPANAHPVLQAP